MAVGRADWLPAPEIEQAKRLGWWRLSWQDILPRQKVISDVFRLAAFSAAFLQLLAFPHGPGYHASEVTGLVVAAGIYSILKIAQPFSWQLKTRAANISLLMVDIIMCVLLVHFTGRIHSPFLLYTLLPVLGAALTRDYTVTVFVSLITSAYVLIGNIYNPATNYMLTLQGVSDFIVYMIALGSVAVLPYAINLRAGQQLQDSGAATERRRISHELHDSVCQTLCGLRWQMQRFAEHVPADANLANELKKMEESVKAAEQDARGLLEVIRILGENGSFMPNVKHYLEQLEHYAGINYRLEGETDIKLSASVEHELSMICIEAFSNIKKHSGARNILFSIKRDSEYIQIKIRDDGCGFDVWNKPARSGHGLDIMQERAKAIGGTLRIISSSDKGTEFIINIRGEKTRI